MKNTESNFAKRVTKYLKENEQLLKKHNLASRVIVSVPEGKPTLIIRLAMWILNSKGAKLDTEFRSTK